jgi:hypothetical protein
MPVKIVELTSIDARRFTRRSEKPGNIRIDNNSTVTLITETGKKEADVEFRYTASYGSVGVIKIEGTLVWEGDARELVSKWSASNNMPDNVASEIHTAIMRTCVPEAVFISRDLHLPPPIPLPQVNISKKKGRSKQSSGMEVA